MAFNYLLPGEVRVPCDRAQWELARKRAFRMARIAKVARDYAHLGFVPVADAKRLNAYLPELKAIMAKVGQMVRSTYWTNDGGKVGIALGYVDDVARWTETDLDMANYLIREENENMARILSIIHGRLLDLARCQHVGEHVVKHEQVTLARHRDDVWGNQYLKRKWSFDYSDNAYQGDWYKGACWYGKKQA